MSSFAKPTNSERENGRGGEREEGRNLMCALCSQLFKYYIKLKTLCSFCREGIKWWRIFLLLIASIIGVGLLIALAVIICSKWTAYVKLHVRIVTYREPSQPTCPFYNLLLMLGVFQCCIRFAVILVSLPLVSSR